MDDGVTLTDPTLYTGARAMSPRGRDPGYEMFAYARRGADDMIRDDIDASRAARAAAQGAGE